MNQLYEILLKDCNKALKKKEVPISALIVDESNKIISHAFNLIETKQDVMAHAEILCIKKTMKKKKNWRLNNYTIYITLEPCVMCAEIIHKSRIKKIKYILPSNHLTSEEKNFLKSFYEKNNIEITQIEDKISYINILQTFFKNRRKNL